MTPGGPYVIRFLPQGRNHHLADLPYHFASAEDREAFLESWREVCDNAGLDRLPEEGVDYELIDNPEGN